MSTIKEKAIEKIREWYYSYEPEPVCYIQRYDEDEEYVGEMDGDFCERCAEIKAQEMDDDCHGKYTHRVCEETMPENCYFSHCSDCGCLLNAEIITGDLAEEDIDDLVYDLHSVKTFDELKGEISWKIFQFLCNEKEFKELFPKQMTYISRRIINLYKKYNKNGNIEE